MSLIYDIQLGSLSEGTLNHLDLARVFLAEVERMHDFLHYEEDQAFAREVMASLKEASSEECLDDAWDFFNFHAPPYVRFGSHEDDGASIGWWPDLDAIEELPRVNDPNEARSIDSDHAFANDHGNVTVYDSSRRVLLELV